MTTTTAPPPAASVAAAGGAPGASRARAVLALARAETRLLARRPFVLLFFAVYAAATAWQTYSGHAGWHELTGREGMADHPALQDADRATQSGALLLGLALFVCADRAVLRSRHRGTDEHFTTLVMEPWRRTLAHALSVVPFALFTGLVVAVRFTCDALAPGAVGHGSAAELAVAPLVVLLAGVAGVLLARLVPSPLAAPLVAVGGFLVATLFTTGADGTHWRRWLFPVVTEEGADPFPSALVGRPAAWHALYLAGLAGLLLGAALLRSGGRSPRVKAFAVLALAATAAGIAGQSPGPSAALLAARAQVTEHPETAETCVTHGATTYCALPEWAGRTGDWAKAVDRVRSLAGPGAATRPLTVRQRVEARYGLEGSSAYDPLTAPGTATVRTRWGGNRVPEFSVGLASVLVAGDERAGAEVCDGRVVTVMWLALGASTDPLEALRDVRLDDSTEGSASVLTPTGGLRMSAAQTTVVRTLLERPRAKAASAVKAHWAELTAPGTSTARVAGLLGVPGVGRGKGAGNSCEE
ncbi:ABC transporter permease [Streptomyces sp. NPDC006743]|uniref:ABC transporter permease n=1 Tax=Streptomyces sp. NPDC006743 TaxID=3154480 RepID=UPI0034545C59